MADRIERYLGRLEAELDGRVDGARLEEILVEVEGHLRESEEAYRELGEPEELANRLAVDGFDQIESTSLAGVQPQHEIPFWTWSFAAIGAAVFAASTLYVLFYSPHLWPVMMAVVAVLGVAHGLFQNGRIGRALKAGVLIGGLSALLLSVVFGRIAQTASGVSFGLSLGNGVYLSGGIPTSLRMWESQLEVRERLASDAKRIANAENFDDEVAGTTWAQRQIGVSAGGYSIRVEEDSRKVRDSWVRFGSEFIVATERMRMFSDEQAARHRQFDQGLSWFGVGVYFFIGIGFLALFGGCNSLVRGVFSGGKRDRPSDEVLLRQVSHG